MDANQITQSLQLDPTISALAGALIGGVIGVVGTVLTAWFAASRERLAFRRSVSLQHCDRVREAYEHALNVLVNMSNGGNPDRTTYGNLFAQVALLGSPEVDSLIQNYLEQSQPRKAPDLPKIIAKMKTHMAALRNELG